MRVEIDQSGKIGDTKVPTALAFSNGKRSAILIPATVKRECLHHLRGRRKLETRLYIQLFAVALFLLLKGHIDKLKQIDIDTEYPGHESKIKEHLINLFRRAGVPVSPDHIQFVYVGKKSNAHKVAFDTFKGNCPPDKIIQASQLMAQFKNKK